MQHDRRLIREAEKREERRVFLLRALQARHDPDGKESADERR